ncbi:hypothetical protein [Mycolicibacterium septicum]|uniref:hypothetical protein n=1 Tax=Mycolicibacterium septicum TaxID=98668 RepID=UPI0003FCBC8A|nr:hypothetical protein [Mycolicibacterium septicum]
MAGSDNDLVSGFQIDRTIDPAAHIAGFAWYEHGTPHHVLNVDNYQSTTTQRVVLTWKRPYNM